jgi:hypothetical protein
MEWKVEKLFQSTKIMGMGLKNLNIKYWRKNI